MNPIKLSSPATREFWEIPVLFEDEHLLALEVAPDPDATVAPPGGEPGSRGVECGHEMGGVVPHLPQEGGVAIEQPHDRPARHDHRQPRAVRGCGHLLDGVLARNYARADAHFRAP